MKTMPYPVRIPKHLLELADFRAAEEQVDRSTALRQLLHVGAVTYVLDVLAKGRISLSKAAELLDATPLAIARRRGRRALSSEPTWTRTGRPRHGNGRPHSGRARGDRGRPLDLGSPTRQGSSRARE
jgi:hypothetical protein